MIKENIKKRKGFTLTELLVSITIISVTVVIVFFNGREFNDNFALVSVAKELSLSIRQAQSYGVSVKEDQSTSGQFGYAYGIAFILDDSNAYMFIDRNSNRKYDGDSSCSSSSECIEKIPMKYGIYTYEICGVILGNSSNYCSSSNRKAHITFLRPSTDASISITNPGDNDSSTWTKARIRLRSPKLKNMYIIIDSTGQINISST